MWQQREKMFVPGHGPVQYRFDYDQIFRDIAAGRRDRKETYRWLSLNDLFFLLCFGLGRFDANVPFVIMMCQQVESGPESDTLDLWAREHYKSTVITYARTIQRVLRNPNIRVGIFSHTRPIAKGFLRQIKQSFEQPLPMKSWFPEIFFDNPEKQSPKWSEDDGIQVKRTNVAKEATVEAWGVVKGQPVSKHFDLMIYDDVVTAESVTTPEMIEKSSLMMQVAVSLGTDGGETWYVGTHYHFADYWSELRERFPADRIRIRPATHDGTLEGVPVLLSMERLEKLREDQGPYVFSCQQLLNPIDPSRQDLRWEWIRTYYELPEQLSIFLLVDPANSKKTTSDFTAMGVIGVDVENWNRYLLDGCYERLDLAGRYSMLQQLTRRWPNIKRIGYERYGLQSDIEHFQEMERRDGEYLPPIVELGGQMAKTDRIKRLIPPMKQGKVFFPKEIIRGGVDINKVMELEMNTFPFSKHDDFLDMFSRQMDKDMMIQGDPMFKETTIANLTKAATEPKLRYTINSDLQFISEPEGQMKVWQEPRGAGSYIIGVYPQHSAYGASVICVVSHDSGKQVAVWRGNAPPEVLAVLAIAVAKRYGGAWLVPDTEKTELLMQTIFARGYRRVFAEAEVIPPNKPKPRYGFKVNQKTMGILIGQVQREIRGSTHGMVDVFTIEELRAFRRTDDDKVTVETGFSRERVLAYSLASYAKLILPKPIASSGMSTDMTPPAAVGGWGAFT